MALPGTVPRLLICLLACLLCSACTIVGSGLGLAVVAVVPGPYEHRQDYVPSGMTPERFSKEVNPSKGDRIRVSLKDGRVLVGKYGGFVASTEKRRVRRRDGQLVTIDAPPEPAIWVAAPDDTRVLLADVVVVEVDAELIGYYWLIGTGVGAVLDVLFISAAAALSSAF